MCGRHQQASVAKQAARSQQSIAPSCVKLLYFAYGANTNSAVLKKRGVVPLSAQPAAFKGGLGFSHCGGYANIFEGTPATQTAPGSPVYDHPQGVLFELSPQDLARLASFETGYRQRHVLVVTLSGTETAATAFVSAAALQLPSSVPPRRRYRDTVLVGVREHGCAAEYASWLASLPVVEDGAPLGPEYYRTPSEGLAAAFVAAAAAVLLASFVLR